MVGNVTLLESVPLLHIHTTISDDENDTYGGHLKSAVVAVTLEVHLVAFAAALERTLDAEIGLPLIHCPHTQ
jgi:predicted DNA-binding protein with PD1-like motif